MNAFAVRIAIESAPHRRTNDNLPTAQGTLPSRWARIRRAVHGRASDVRATPK